MAKLTQRDILKNFLRERRLTQAEFAQKLGIYPQVVTLWMNGKRNISMRSIRKIEEVFQTKIEL